jgi:CHASE1-domain containing sensor protein
LFKSATTTTIRKQTIWFSLETKSKREASLALLARARTQLLARRARCWSALLCVARALLADRLVHRVKDTFLGDKPIWVSEAPGSWRVIVFVRAPPAWTTTAAAFLSLRQNSTTTATASKPVDG